MRQLVPTEENLLAPSFKVAVSFTPAEAIAVASELLTAALPQLAKLLAPPHPVVDAAVPVTAAGDSVEGA